MARSTFSRVAARTRSGRLSTLETVPRETPAEAATSFTEAPRRTLGRRSAIPVPFETWSAHPSG